MIRMVSSKVHLPQEAGCSKFSGAIIAIMGLFFLVGGLKKYLTVQKMAITPTSKVRSAAVGLVELYGKARPAVEVMGPISNEKCAYWRIFAGTKDDRLLMDQSWKGFYLEDETGKILIKPSQKMLFGEGFGFPHRNEYEGFLPGEWFGIKQIEKPFLDYLKLQPKGVQMLFEQNSHKYLRATEGYIKDGDPVYVLGRAVPSGKEGSDFSDENITVEMEELGYSSESDLASKSRSSFIIQIVGGIALIALGLFLIIF